MEVFVLTISEVFDFIDYDHKPKVFLNKEDAVKEMKDCFNSFKSEMLLTSLANFEDEINGDKWFVDKGENFYDAYIDGRYPEYHYTIKISKVEVK